MKQLRISTLLLISVFAVGAHAQTKKKAAPAETPAAVSAAAPTPVATAPAVEPTHSVVASAPPPPNVENYEGLHVRLRIGPSYSSQRLSSDGMNSNLPQTYGLWYGAEVHYRPAESVLGYWVKANENSVRYQDLSAVTPGNTAVKEDVVSAAVTISPLKGTNSSWNNLYFGIGYYYQVRDADVTNPMVANGMESNGPIAVLGTFDKLTGKAFYEFDLAVMYPNSLRESPARTGFYSQGLTTEAGFKVVLPYTDLLDLAVGLQVRYSMITYEGQDTSPRGRGTINAKESVLATAIPFELRFRF